MPKILIIDTDELARQGLRHLLRHEYRDAVFGEACNTEQAANRLTEASWDLITLALRPSDGSGFSVLSEIRQRQPGGRVLVFGTSADSECAACVERLGALGYISSNATRATRLRAIRTVFLGKTYFEGSRISERVPDISQRNTTLSAREQAVMLALASGKRSSEIAADLGLSIKTVSTYKRRFFNKLRLNTIAEVVHYVRDHKRAGSASG